MRDERGGRRRKRRKKEEEGGGTWQGLVELLIHEGEVIQHVVAQQRLWGGTEGSKCRTSQSLVTFFALSRALNTCVNPRASCSALGGKGGRERRGGRQDMREGGR